MGKAVQASYDQDAFRGRTNVTNPTGVNTAFDSEDAIMNNNWTQDVGTLFRIRFVIQQTVETANTGLATTFVLQYQVNSGGWNDVVAQGETTDAVRYSDADFTDGDDTTQILGSGNFVTGDGVEVTPSDTVTFTEAALSETELEFALEIYSGQVSNNDAVELRVIQYPDIVLGAYTNTPSLTVAKEEVADVSHPDYLIAPHSL